MTRDQEQQLLTNLYDRLWEAVTYAPADSSQPAVFDKKTTLIQFTKNEAIKPEDFANPISPSNPNGSMAAGETFSRMVDVVPAVQIDYAPTANRLSDTYRQIVDGANSDVKIDPQQQKLYDSARDYLEQEVTMTDFQGKESIQIQDTPIFAAYKNNQQKYLSALSAYRSAFLDYNMEDVKDQRQWGANEPSLRNALTTSFNDWQAQGKAQVEEALAAMASTINAAVRNVIEAAQDGMRNQALPSALGDTSSFHLAYALPSSWMDPSNMQGYSRLSLKNSNLRETSDSRYDKFGGSTSFNTGLWRVKANVSHESKSENHHMDADEFELRASIGIVRIFRPWFNDLLFKVGSWSMQGVEKNGISSGDLQDPSIGKKILPLVPTAFVIAKDVVISANFSEEDRQHIESATSGSASVGWGPFSIGGNYAHGSTSDSFNASFSNGELRIPGVQIVAWVSEIVPPSPPEGMKASDARELKAQAPPVAK